MDILKHEVKEMGNKGDLEVAAGILGVATTLRAVTAEVKRRFGLDAQGIWLASRKGVKTYEFASDGKTRVGTATKISIPANAIKLIDLGEPDGAFFVFKNR